jgi:CheY-like chemotaxis protein
MEEMGSLSGRRILIVEDDYFIAQILTQMLEDAGAVVLGPIGQVEEALNFIGRNGSAVDSAVGTVQTLGGS